jgi:hypothetical protein
LLHLLPLKGAYLAIHPKAVVSLASKAKGAHFCAPFGGTHVADQAPLGGTNTVVVAVLELPEVSVHWTVIV